MNAKAASAFSLFILNAAALGLISYVVIRVFRMPLTFDDAFMFQRYAVHLREGLGVSWNPDGIHTGGMTSLGWFLVVFPLSFLPLDQGHFLAIGSFFTGLAGIAWMGLQISRLSSCSRLRSFWLLFPSLTLLLISTSFFRYNMVNGMDTMLSFSLDGALSCSLWAWCKDQRGPVRGTILLGLIGAGAIIARPENGLFAILSPILGALLLRGSDRKADIFRPALACAGFIGIYLVCYRTYFHAWLPLSFYMKSRHPYLGYTGAIRWLPEAYLRKFFLLAGPILVFPLLCLNYRSLRVAVTYLVPIALTFAYLENVTQIMGGNARYYVPFVAPVLVGALWMTDLSLQGDWRRSLFVRRFRIAVLCPVISLSGIAIWSQARTWSQHRLLVAPYAAPKIVVATTSPLPELPWFEVINTLANEIVKPLPPGTLVAASEVGLIGAAAPQVGVIDLAGLNDNDIALRGFSMDRLLDREPVLIWFPHGDYTWQRQAMLCSPRLLRAYNVLGGNAFNYSLAIRRRTPVTGQLDESVVKAFRSLYPGSAMEDYLASSIKCD